VESSQKKSSTRNSVALSRAEKDRANEFFKENAPDLTTQDIELDANLKGLEQLEGQLNETQKKVLQIIVTDFSPENEAEAEKDVFKKLRNACARAGLRDKKSDEIDFFRVLGDPKFGHIVKTTGQGIIGLYIVPLAAKLINMALEGDKTCMKWALEIAGLLQSKYDFYLQRVALTKANINVGGDLNFEGKSDKELEELINSIEHVPEAEVTFSEVGTGQTPS